MIESKTRTSALQRFLACGLLLLTLGLVACGGSGLDVAKEAPELASFAQKIRIVVEVGKNKKTIKEIEAQPSFRAFIGKLIEAKLVNDVQLVSLAGNSGKTIEGEITAEKFTKENCIFTGPTSGAAHISALQEHREDKKIGPLGVTFTLRSDLLDQALEGDGKFPIAIGTKMHLVTLEELSAMIAKDESLPQKDLKGLKSGELFGTYPFEHVAKE